MLESNPSRQDDLSDWPTIRHYGRELWGKSNFDESLSNKKANPLQLILDWLRAEHGKNRDYPVEFIPRYEVAALLQVAVEASRRIKGTRPEQGEGNIITNVTEANRVAMKLAKQKQTFVSGTVREWAEAIRQATGKKCSIATVQATRLWQETMKTTGRGKTKGRKPKAVTFTKKMEAVAGEGSNHEVLKELIAQQQDDDEPSPLDSTHKKVRQRKRV
jgi:hypothetical protein